MTPKESSGRVPWSLLIHTCFLQLTSHIVRPTSAYHALELGVDIIYLGLIAASFSVIPMLIAIGVGHSVDSGNENRVLLVGAGLTTLACIGLLLFAPSLEALLLWNCLLGVGHVFGAVAQQSRVSRTHPEKTDSAFGLYSFAGSVGQSIAPLLLIVAGGSALLPNTKMLFSGALASSLVVVAATLMLTAGRFGKDSQSVAERLPLLTAFTSAVGVRGKLFKAVFASMLILAAIDLTTVYLPAWGVERGVGAASIGLLLTLRSLAMMMSRPFLGVLVARIGRSRLIILSATLAAAATALLVAPLALGVVAVVLFVAGIGLGIGQPLTMSVVSATAPLRSRGTWLAVRLTGNSLGQTVIPPSVGIFSASLGVSGVFGITAMALAAVAIIWSVPKRGNPL